jgi:cyclohexanone monooxygenase
MNDNRDRLDSRLKSAKAAEADLPFDVDEVRARYDHEREIRLNRRPEGNAQYSSLPELAKKDDRFAAMLRDRWTPVVPRAPLTDSVQVLVIGAGYGGLLAGARLVQQGIDSKSIRLLDVAGDVGGTWYFNRYPGAMCDIESYTYMPLLEDLGYVPSEKYAHQPELLHHSQLIAKKYGLYENACFNTTCTGLEWNESRRMWSVITNRGDRFHAQFVIMNFGTLTQPKLPGAPGVEKFRGHMFHTSRWDYDYTGGDTTGGLANLHNKRVAIVGTGATAIQVVPHLGADSKRLTVFQRTPSSVDVRDNRATTPDFASSYLKKPGWQKERMDNFTLITQANVPGIPDLIQDGWTKVTRNLNHEFRVFRKNQTKLKLDPKSIGRMIEVADMKQMHSVRTRAEMVVKDPETAEKLKPWYQQFCKRPCFHDEYLPTFNRANVELVHDPHGIERITADGIVSNGKEYAVDCIVFATGFEVGFQASERGFMVGGYDIVGRGGVKLSEKWSKGPRTLKSFSTHGFPNFFMQNAPQGTFTTNFVQKLDEEAQHVGYLIGKMNREGIVVYDPSKKAEDKWCDAIYRRSGRGAKFLKRCTPGYYNREGKISEGKTLNSTWGNSFLGNPLHFFELLRKERDENTVFDEIDIEYAAKL